MKNKTSITHKLGISFYAMLSVVFFAGCMNTNDNRKGAIIQDFQSWGNDKCKYTAKQIQSWGTTVWYFYDDCAKFNIGDTVSVSKKNY